MIVKAKKTFVDRNIAGIRKYTKDKEYEIRKSGEQLIIKDDFHFGLVVDMNYINEHFEILVG